MAIREYLNKVNQLLWDCHGNMVGPGDHCFLSDERFAILEAARPSSLELVDSGSTPPEPAPESQEPTPSPGEVADVDSDVRDLVLSLHHAQRRSVVRAMGADEDITTKQADAFIKAVDDDSLQELEEAASEFLG
jgi:hypothetical protein